jgi:hypothetical protein
MVLSEPERMRKYVHREEDADGEIPAAVVIHAPFRKTFQTDDGPTVI